VYLVFGPFGNELQAILETTAIGRLLEKGVKMSVAANFFLVLMVLVSSVNAHCEVIFVAETGFIIQNKIQVNSNKEETWNVFTRQVQQWWPSDHTWWGDAGILTIDTHAGGCFCEKSGKKSAEHMQVSYVDPNNIMRMTGGLGPLQGMGMFGALEWSFNTNKHGTEVTMTYKVNGISPEGFTELAPIVDRVQAIQLNGLEDFVRANN